MIKRGFLKIEFQPRSVNVLVGEVNELYVESYFSQLNEQEKNRAKSFTRDIDRATYVTCRSQLKKALGSILEVSPQRIEITEGVNGKPYLENAKVHFSVTHSEGVFMIACTQLGELGIDMEWKTKRVEFGKLEDLLLSDYELTVFNNIPNEEKKNAFLRYWTRKESFFKAVGTGLSAPLKELVVSIEGGAPVEILRTGWDPADRDNWKICDVKVHEDFISTVTVKSNFEPEIMITALRKN